MGAARRWRAKLASGGVGVVRAIHPSIVWGARQMCERALLRLSWAARRVRAGGVCGVETVVTLWWWRASSEQA